MALNKRRWQSLPFGPSPRLPPPNASDLSQRNQFRWIQLFDSPSELLHNYAEWRSRFMRRRIRLGLLLALVYFSAIALMHLIPYVSQGQFHLRLVTNGLTALNMLAWLGWLQLPVGKRHPEYAFLGLAWGINVLTNLAATLEGKVSPDITGWTLSFLGMAAIIPFRWPMHLLSHLGAYAYYFGVNSLLGLQVIPEQVSYNPLWFDVLWILFLPNLAVYLYERLSKSEFEARAKLREEQKRSQRLLLNILPQSVAERLMEEHRTIAESFAEVSVLFADLVGFTAISATMPPTELVELLNQIFSRFDQLAELHGLEKIKTIGDAYMVVAGLPHARADHAVAIANMALDMQRAIAEFNQTSGRGSALPIALRIGIHTGPVVAGVIGLKKFAYDLWGDTVNVASRMESHSIPGAIQVSHSTYECLQATHQFEPRGWIEVKGRGEMLTYWLKGQITSQPSA